MADSPDRAIAALDDPKTREAVMAVRSEFFSAMLDGARRFGDASSDVRKLIAELSVRMGVHLEAYEHEGRSREQWQASATRLLERLEKKADDHEAEDERRFAACVTKEDHEEDIVEVKKKIAEDRSAAHEWRTTTTRWLLGTQAAIIVGLLGVVGTLFWRIMGMHGVGP